jgi:hypothetical protein
MDTIPLGRLAATPDGAIAPATKHEIPRLRFAWRGRPCRAEIAPDGIRLAADAAWIPSTAEPGADRRRAFQAVAELPRRLPKGWRARLTPDHRIRVEACAPLTPPANATALVGTLVRFALDLDPVLDALEAEGVTACVTPG